MMRKGMLIVDLFSSDAPFVSDLTLSLSSLREGTQTYSSLASLVSCPYSAIATTSTASRCLCMMLSTSPLSLTGEGWGEVD